MPNPADFMSEFRNRNLIASGSKSHSSEEKTETTTFLGWQILCQSSEIET